MSRATKRYHDTDSAEQLRLLTQEELAALRSSSASLPRKGDIASREAHSQDVEERLIQRAGATQLKLPGI